MTDPPELSELIPRLTRSTISDDERATLYHAAMQGHQLPLGLRHWRRADRGDLHYLECPGCGMQVMPHEPGPLSCIACSHVYLVAPETP